MIPGFYQNHMWLFQVIIWSSNTTSLDSKNAPVSLQDINFHKFFFTGQFNLSSRLTWTCSIRCNKKDDAFVSSSNGLSSMQRRGGSLLNDGSLHPCLSGKHRQHHSVSVQLWNILLLNQINQYSCESIFYMNTKKPLQTTFKLFLFKVCVCHWETEDAWVCVPDPSRVFQGERAPEMSSKNLKQAIKWTVE